MSDFIPLLGYRRRSYLLLLNFLVAGSFLYLSGMTEPGVAMYALFLTGLGVAASDVIVDALMVESGRETGRTRGVPGRAVVLHQRRGDRVGVPGLVDLRDAVAVGGATHGGDLLGEDSRWSWRR